VRPRQRPHATPIAHFPQICTLQIATGQSAFRQSRAKQSRDAFTASAADIEISLQSATSPDGATQMPPMHDVIGHAALLHFCLHESVILLYFEEPAYRWSRS